MDINQAIKILNLFVASKTMLDNLNWSKEDLDEVDEAWDFLKRETRKAVALKESITQRIEEDK